MNVRGLKLENKTKSQQFKIKLIANTIFAILHQIDLRKKVNLINYNPDNKSVIYAMWHGYQWGLGLFPPEKRKNINILVSLSNDGEIISGICDKLGFSLVRGSTNRGGDKALREMLNILEEGQNIAFMVDGPKGPKQKIKKGLIKLAKMSGAPIIPIVPYTKTIFSFNSWDNFQVPTTLYLKSSLIFGNPIYVPQDADEIKEQEIKLKLEQTMFDLEKDVIIEHKQYLRGVKNG